LEIIGVDPINISTWNTTLDEIIRAKHIGEYPTLENSFVLNIDCALEGVGGDDTWSRRSRAMEQYRLTDKSYNYTIILRPTTSRSDAIKFGRMKY
jgi:beta-galactosidase